MRQLVILSLALLLVPSLGFAQSDVGSAIRAQLNLNGTWQYITNLPQSPIPKSGWLPMRVPSAPWTDGTASVWYRQTLSIPTSWVVPGRRFFLELEKCGHYCAIYVNGKFAGDHYGQFAPYEAEVTQDIVGGRDVIFQVYAHLADDNYTHRGAVLNQEPNCPAAVPLCESASYRPEGLTPGQRNWVGIVGDVTLSWRGGNNEYLSAVQILTSYRNSTITANVSVVGASANATVSASVFLNGVDVLDLPSEPVAGASVTLSAPWAKPILWSQANPQLYQLQTTLNDSGVLDQRDDRFGFREVWIDGKQLLLNGKPFWMAGSFVETDSDLRWSDARDPIAMWFYIQESSGLNADVYHWDDAGREWEDLRDEMGILSIGAFFCNGPGNSGAKVDDANAWTSFMIQQAQEVAAAEQNRPSILFWRPFDVVPPGATSNTVLTEVHAAMREVNPSLLFADDSDIATWAQPVENPETKTCDNGQAFAAWLAEQTTPALIREIFGGTGLDCLSAFYKTIYREAYEGGAVGIFIQQLPILDPEPFTPIWPSQSGIGNRPTVTDLPDWISRQWSPSSTRICIAQLYEEFTRRQPPIGSPVDGDYVASSFTSPGFLLPESWDSSAVGVLADLDGTAWLSTDDPGEQTLDYESAGGDVLTEVDVLPPPPF